MTNQPTSDLWVQLCKDLQAQQSTCATGERADVVRKFLQSAQQIFKSPSTRLRDASEIAGDCLLSLDMQQDARGCYEDALRCVDTKDEDRARIATKLALLLESLPGAESEAIVAYQTAIRSYAICEPAQNPTLLNNLAGLLIKRGDRDQAIECYENAISQSKHLHGNASMELALLQSNLAIAHTNSGEFGKAEALHLSALAIREASFGANHPEVASSMANLAVVYHDRGEYRKAEKFYRSALDILKKFRDPTDPEVKWIRDNFERLPHIAVRTLSSTSKM